MVRSTVIIRGMAKACTSLLLAINTREVSFKTYTLAGVMLNLNYALAHSLNVLGILTYPASGDSYAGDWLNHKKTGHGICIPFIVNSL